MEPGPKGAVWKWALAIIATICGLILWRCGAGVFRGRSESGKAVLRFHEELNGGRYREIWQQSDGEFRRVTKEPEFRDFLEAVHTKLGNARSASLNAIAFEGTTDGTLLHAVYKTQFDQDSATEVFIWKTRGDSLKLWRYNVEAKTFVIERERGTLNPASP